MKRKMTALFATVAVTLVCSCMLLTGSQAQEQSVRPGVNKTFQNPDPAQFVERFEREGREIYDLRQEIVDACQLKPGTHVADIGAGTGLFTRLFSPIVGPAGRVYAVDISKRFIDYIQQTCTEQGLKNVVGIVCKQDSAELPPASIDAAFICDTYHHFEFPQKTMQSIHQALKPGGQLILVEFSRIEGSSSNWVLEHVRADQQTFADEIVAAGFRFVEEKKILRDSYFLRFAKPREGESPPTGKAPSLADPLRGKRVIEWGWDEPDTKFMREHVGDMERLPFDGLIFHATSSKGGNLAWEIWGTRKFQIDEFQQAIEDLRATPFRRLSDRFLRVNVTPGKVDWFDDEAWSTVRENFKVAAQLARDSHTKGFMFDIEQYEGSPWDYRKQKDRETKPFAEYQAQLKKRGGEWIEAVTQAYPDITILLTFGYSIAQPRRGAKDRSEVSYGMLADFLDGMIAACPERAMIVDAWESSYPYKKLEQFTTAYDTIRKKGPEWTADAEQYRKHVRAGFGIWMDQDWRNKGWNVDDFTKNHFSPAEFRDAVNAALRVSDTYVWVYTEQPRWWTRERLPQAYIDALADAVKPSAGAANPGSAK